MTIKKPFSQACENNKEAILKVLKAYTKGMSLVLEIGSGTGQHAVHMSSALPSLQWQPSDVKDNIPGISAWMNDDPPKNLLQPIVLDVTQGSWPQGYDAAFSANTSHIMSWQQAQRMIQQVGSGLPMGGLFFLYGPFKYKGEFTSSSNFRFDQWLKSVRSSQGIRDFEKIEVVANKSGLYILDDVAMPANNQTLVWKKKE